MTRSNNSQQIVIPSWIKFVVAAVVLIGALLGYTQQPHWKEWLAGLMPSGQPATAEPTPVDPPTPTASTDPPLVSEVPAETPPTTVPESPSVATSARTTIPNQKIFNESGDEVFQGTVDVGPTLARIQAGERLPFPHDGSTFQNREGRLPRKPSGYYKEYVHPTPKLSGPGPQRIVMGEKGETYYTADHYRTFERLDK